MYKYAHDIIYAETDRLILRSWRDDDLPLFAAMNSDIRVMRFFPSTLSMDESEAFFQRIRDEFNRNGWGLYAVELKTNGCFIGFVGLHEIGFDACFTPGIEIGWRLSAEHHNRGYATEAAAAVIDLARNTGITRLYSFTAAINAPSERVMQKIGMTKVGLFDHPKLPNDSPLLSHCLYMIEL